ncbi:ABC transporter substrate-binding protein [Vogesella sp. LIG4]|uniref:substrate-binding periplasmic protein n=1 Tax=Vogesella sp. LIG4 TaxID=1192162 RepID=UPI00081FD906|nr:transporter substrate-binding domain-containing protein [Vogesella sp. LIG4]SCK12156.1 ABC-type amino acid transport substrate-binding protein [Vogesella sp. LIG4]
MKTARIKLAALLLLWLANAWGGDVVKVGFPESIPPWVNVDKRPGIAVELLVEALRSEGLTVTPVFYPFTRRVSAYRRGELDALYDVSPSLQHEYQLPGSAGRPLHSFDNVVVALQRRQLQLETLQDLQPLRVVAWDGAQADIPNSGYDSVLAIANGNYSEIADQVSQLRTLYLGRCDVIFTDRLIFEWNRRKLGKQAQLAVAFYPLLPPKEADVLWHDATLRQHYDAGLRRIKQDGRYDAIFRRYQSEPQP